MKTSDIAKEDFKFFIEEGDPGFSPERNKSIIEGTIKKHEANMARKDKEHTEQLRERADAVATYLKSKWASSTNPIERYFSEQELARLRGQKRIEKIRTLMNGQQYIEFEELN